MSSFDPLRRRRSFPGGQQGPTVFDVSRETGSALTAARDRSDNLRAQYGGFESIVGTCRLRGYESGARPSARRRGTRDRCSSSRNPDDHPTSEWPHRCMSPSRKVAHIHSALSFYRDDAPTCGRSGPESSGRTDYLWVPPANVSRETRRYLRRSKRNSSLRTASTVVGMPEEGVHLIEASTPSAHRAQRTARYKPLLREQSIRPGRTKDCSRSVPPRGAWSIAIAHREAANAHTRPRPGADVTHTGNPWPKRRSDWIYQRGSVFHVKHGLP